MNLEIREISNCELEFGGIGAFNDPKIGLREAGPFDLRFGGAQLKELKIGIVGTEKMILKAINWLEKCQSPIVSIMKNTKQYPDFEGFENIFKSKLVLNSIWNYVIDEKELDTALKEETDHVRFQNTVDLFSNGFNRIANLETTRPNLILCAINEEVLEACGTLERKLTKAQKKALLKIAKTDNPTFDQNIEDQGEDLIFRDFRRALKARAIQAKIPIQIGRDNLFLDSDTNQDAATRAWNSSVTMYYKAGGIPWRLKNKGIDTCYVGITFHHLKTTSRAIVKSCLAQGFSSEGEGFALRGADVIPDSTRGNKRVTHLTEEQAFTLGNQILAEYLNRTGVFPQRVVLHKTSVFNDAEHEGFRSAFNSIPIVELINLLPTSFMLLKHGAYPPNRGTLCSVNNSSHYLFNTGYIKEIETYPGPHIPRPIEIRSKDEINIINAAEDILGLARMNWNTSSITGGEPVTLFFSKQVGGIMSELAVQNSQTIPTSFRYYI